MEGRPRAWQAGGRGRCIACRRQENDRRARGREVQRRPQESRDEFAVPEAGPDRQRQPQRGHRRRLDQEGRGLPGRQTRPGQGLRLITNDARRDLHGLMRTAAGMRLLSVMTSCQIMIVIASEAKQSRSVAKSWIASSPFGLLAMTIWIELKPIKL